MTAEQVRSMFVDRALKAVDILSIEARVNEPMVRVAAASAAALTCAVSSGGREHDASAV